LRLDENGLIENYLADEIFRHVDQVLDGGFDAVHDRNRVGVSACLSTGR